MNFKRIIENDRKMAVWVKNVLEVVDLTDWIGRA